MRAGFFVLELFHELLGLFGAMHLSLRHQVRAELFCGFHTLERAK
jgi:hypothetical protein